MNLTAETMDATLPKDRRRDQRVITINTYDGTSMLTITEHDTTQTYSTRYEVCNATQCIDMDPHAARQLRDALIYLLPADPIQTVPAY